MDHLYDSVSKALEPAKDVCAWMVYAAYNANLATSEFLDGPLSWADAEKRRQELLSLTPHRDVRLLFDVGQLS